MTIPRLVHSRWLRLVAALLGAVGLAVLVSCRQERSPETDAAAQDAGQATSPPLAVFADIPPLAYLTQRVGGPLVCVDVLVQPGQDPHVFEPSPRRILALGKAKLLLKIGLPFEDRLVEKIAERQPDLTVVDAARGIQKRSMTGAEEQGHDHAGQPDPHVWLSPPLLKVLAANVAAALAQVDPAHAGDYAQNLADLDAEIDALHARIARTLSPYRGQSFYVFHPAFGYFGDAYGLRQEAVELEGKSPAPRQLRALIQRAQSEGVRIIFVQPQFDPRSAQAVAEAIGGAVVPLDPLAKNVLENLDEVAMKIAASREEK
jgi:zinc transport system substrate-binding protein